MIDRAWRRAAEIADHHGTAGGIGARVEIVFAQIDPAVAHHVMRDAHERFPAGVADAIQLIAAIRTREHPGVNRIKSRHRNRWGVGGGGGFRGAQRSEAIRHIARRAPKSRLRAIRPTAGKRDARTVVVENHLVGLMPERAHGHDGGAGVETVLREEIELIEIAVVLVHLVADAALQAASRWDQRSSRGRCSCKRSCPRARPAAVAPKDPNPANKAEASRQERSSWALAAHNLRTPPASGRRPVLRSRNRRNPIRVLIVRETCPWRRSQSDSASTRKAQRSWAARPHKTGKRLKNDFMNRLIYVGPKYPATPPAPSSIPRTPPHKDGGEPCPPRENGNPS
jgi:hypothetical protein